MNRVENKINSKMFVGNVPFDCTNIEFRDCFKNAEGYVIADLINMRGFGFVVLSSPIYRDNILKENNFFLKNRKLRLSVYDNQPKNNNIEVSSFIKLENISPNVSRDDIQNEFKNFCEVGKCFIDTNRITGEKLSTGIVEIFDVEVLHQLLSLGTLLMHDKSEIILKPFNKKSDNQINKHKKKTTISKEEYFEIYNAGRNAGLIEGTKLY
jgi:RNA recognition motif-containing protein